MSSLAQMGSMYALLLQVWIRRLTHQLKSVTRGKLTTIGPRPSGKNAYRFLLNRASVLQHPDVDRIIPKDGELVFWLGADR
ncbi:Acetoacetate decarboxylase beta barrel domain protein [Purpureocillium lavendulum]|uniref:Acetoacetate decarboxylase beta barrel domain protein n=1 Tax=Purpureocillium lavendulum TaxID=1247861 RepID=A0AB34FI67_9HYPO|nr:Acetoacetate decarboxylase beta barrel domain protein [Purpureocillium lavendulum]